MASAEGVQVGRGYVQIIPSAKGIKGSISSILSGESSDAGSKAGALAGSNLVGAVKGIIATAGLSAVVGKALTEGAALQQSIGGIETLYKDSSAKMIEYANQAYKTAGLSANAYMEQSTSFAASLVSSLGGDTAKAAEAANQAIIDMADNSNKMGTSLSSIQNAYAGFAKQNYTMLDNLKLGYGGTKSEMERLIADANEYRKEQGLNSDLTIDSYADIITAIESVQEKQHIAGTTAKESMTTIQGAATATKAAWKNVLTAIAGGGNIKKAMKQLTTSLFGGKEGEGLLNQVIPRIQQIMEGVGEFVATAAPLIADKLPALVTAILPSLLTAAGSLIKALARAIPGLLSAVWQTIKSVAPTLWSTIKDIATGIPGALAGIMDSIGNWVTTSGPTLLAKGKELFDNLVNGIADGITNIGDTLLNISDAITSWISGNLDSFSSSGQSIWDGIVSGLSGAIGTIGTALAGVGTKILEWINGDGLSTLYENGMALWEKIKEGFTNALSDIGTLVLKIITGIGTWITQNYDSIAQAGKNILSYIIEGFVSVATDVATGMLALITAAVSWIIANSGTILSTGKTIVTYIINGIIEAVKTIGKGFVDLVTNIATWISENSPSISELGESILDWIVTGISNAISNIKDGFNGMVAQISEKVTTLSASLSNIGLTILTKIKNGIANNISKVKEGLSGLVGALREKVTSLATSLSNVGSLIVTKIVDGIKDLAEKIKNKIQSALNAVAQHTFIFSPKVNATTGKVEAGAYSGHNQEYAKAKNAPYLFTKSTVFGRYNGESLIAGEAGPEMLLGVNKLNAMLYQSVQGGMQSMMGQMQEMISGLQGSGNAMLEAKILDVLERYLPNIADRQIVLDSGAIAGAIAPGVNSALGAEVVNRRRYNA